jgi:membrane fusion protein, copper/silver efflux system
MTIAQRIRVVTTVLAILLTAPRAQAEQSQAPQLAAIRVSPERRQMIGLKLATVDEQELTDQIDASGTIEPDEQLQSYVQTRFAGWIKTVFADQTYASVKRGAPLFTIYSPDLVSGEQEYLLARSEGQRVAQSSVPGVKDGADSTASAALDRLRLFGVAPREIARLEREGTARDTIEIDAPASGFVTERAALPNLYAQPDMRLFTIADLSRVWVYAAVFQDDIGRIKVGDPVAVSIDAYPGRSFDGRIDSIWPAIDPMTRTARVRCSFTNPGGVLKLGMFVNVALKPKLGRGLVIPDSGVLRTGIRNVVFVSRGDGYLEPVDVELGAHLGDRFEVLKGLRAGQEIVASANFLIDSESQLQAALGTFVPPPPGVGANASPANAAKINATVEATIAMTTEPDPPQRGSNTVRIALSDSSGKPIAGADVSVVFFMPAMPAMQMAAMKAVATPREESPGHYVATIELPMGGTWQVTVAASKGGESIASRELSVSATGPMM